MGGNIMKKRSVLALAVVIMLASILTGCTKTCNFIGCKDNAKLFKDYCQKHQDTMDAVDDVIDGVRNLFNR
jgi:hypothetical protein